MKNATPKKLSRKLWINIVKRAFCATESDTLGISHCQYSQSAAQIKPVVCVLCLGKQYVNYWIGRS